MWSTTSSRLVYQNAWIRVREDEIVRPDGQPGVYGVVDVRSPAVFVVALTDEDEVVLVTIDRYTTGQATPEIPAGGSDGEDLLAAAQRELQEETGFTAARWRRLGRVDSLNGIAAAPGEVFLATELGERGETEPDAEGIVACRAVPFGELAAMISRGEITDNETLGALMLAVVALGRLRI